MSTPVPPRGSRGNRGRNTQNRPGNRPGAGRPGPATNRSGSGGNQAGTRQPARSRQAAYQRKRRQQQLLFGGIGLVLVIVVVLVVVAVTSGGGSGGSNSTPLASRAILRPIEGVSPETLATQAKSDPILSPPTPIKNGTALTADGKPKIVYIGAEYCPYCGGERWAMIMALSKFGTFTGIKQITSSTTDDPAAIPTFSFLGANYRSRYLVFSSTETETVDRSPLQTPSAANAALEAKYDAPPYTQQGGIPFVDIGGKWVIDGVSYDVTPMQHLSHATVAQAAATGSTKYGADIQSTAGAIVSRLCNLTGGQPGNVCKSFPSVIGK